MPTTASWTCTPSPSARCPADLRRRTLEQLAQYIACGLDPKKNTHVHPEPRARSTRELGWVLDCYTMFGELSRMTQFKDKSAKHADNINAGLFTYPALMAADILLYQADLVPVGERPEAARGALPRHRPCASTTFTATSSPSPSPISRPTGARIMSLSEPGRARCPSRTRTPTGASISCSPRMTLCACFKRAVTDSETGHCVYACPEKLGVTNLMQIYSVCHR